MEEVDKTPVESTSPSSANNDQIHDDGTVVDLQKEAHVPEKEDDKPAEAPIAEETSKADEETSNTKETSNADEVSNEKETKENPSLDEQALLDSELNQTKKPKKLSSRERKELAKKRQKEKATLKKRAKAGLLPQIPLVNENHIIKAMKEIDI